MHLINILISVPSVKKNTFAGNINWWFLCLLNYSISEGLDKYFISIFYITQNGIFILTFFYFNCILKMKSIYHKK